MKLPIKRVYAEPAPDDGTRVLVDRLWPRGVRKERIDLWLKDIAPSDALRHQFHGQPAHWDAFCAAYAAELGSASARAALDRLREALQAGPVTLLYAARDETRNNAAALRDWLLLGQG
jgi:uncharacterized protein YeaO (DUF488 family)